MQYFSITIVNKYCQLNIDNKYWRGLMLVIYGR
jgi:hypothetical protein